MESFSINISSGRNTENIPPEIKGWNWGAFFLPAIWGIGNKIWIALLAIIPFPLLWIIMMFVLGSKGNEWAWKKNNWKSVDHFKNVQKKWAIIGFVIFIIPLLIVLKGLVTLINNLP